MGARRRCCCAAACILLQEDFEALSVGTNIGPKLTEISGDWSIDFSVPLYSKVLKEAGTSGATVLAVKHNPFPGELFLSALAVNPQAGDIYHLILSADDSGTADHYVEFEVASPKWHVRLYAGATLLLEMDMTGNDLGADKYLMEACIGDNAFMASTGYIGEEFPWVEESPGTGDRFGLRNGSGTVLYFDDILAYTIVHNNVNCYQCLCSCYRNIIDRSLVLTFTNCTGRMACLEGQTVTLDFTWHAGGGTWDGEWTDGDGNVWRFSLGCGTMDPAEGPGANFVLAIDTANVCLADYNLAGAEVGSTCEPLSLIFSGYTNCTGNLACTICGYPPGSPNCPPGDPTEGTCEFIITE